MILSSFSHMTEQKEEHGRVVMKFLVFFTFSLQLASADSHSLQYFLTGCTPEIHFQEFTLVGAVDGEQFVYYDSDVRKMIPKTEWIKKFGADDPAYWDTETQDAQINELVLKSNLLNAMQRFNHTGGVHTVQWKFGCELKHDGTKRGSDEYGYDGEDFLSLDESTFTWTAYKPQAVITKNKLDASNEAEYIKNYLENTCIEWLRKYVELSRPYLERKVPPEVDVFQKDSSSPVVCHATGFFPKEVMISWKKNGEDLYEDVHLGETMVNEDGTFQKKSVLTVSPEELDRDKYTCVVQHAGLENEKILNGSDRRILRGGVPVAVITGVVAVLLLIVVGVVGFFVWKKKSGFKPVSQTPSEDSASDKS